MGRTYSVGSPAVRIRIVVVDLVGRLPSGHLGDRAQPGDRHGELQAQRVAFRRETGDAIDKAYANFGIAVSKVYIDDRLKKVLVNPEAWRIVIEIAFGFGGPILAKGIKNLSGTIIEKLAKAFKITPSKLLNFNRSI